MDQAFRNLVSMGLSLEEASLRLSKIPSELLGLSDRGVFREGASADFVVLNRDLTIAEVIIEGDIL
jgi:N-acetylglucosamine-6-phosphate deacetylase